MIRFNPKTGRWSDELPSRLCDWLAGPAVIGGAAPPPGPPVLTFDSSNNVSGTGTSYSHAVGGAIPIGAQLYLAVMTTNGGLVTSASDSKGNSWAVDTTKDEGSNVAVALLSCVTIAAFSGSESIAVNFNFTAGARTSILSWATNMLAAAADRTNSASGNGTSPSTTTAATTTAHQLVLSALAYNSATLITQAGGWTSIANKQNGTANRTLYQQYKEVNATGAQTYAPTGPNAQWAVGISTYKAAA